MVAGRAVARTLRIGEDVVLRRQHLHARAKPRCETQKRVCAHMATRLAACVRACRCAPRARAGSVSCRPLKSPGEPGSRDERPGSRMPSASAPRSPPSAPQPAHFPSRLRSPAPWRPSYHSRTVSLACTARRSPEQMRDCHTAQNHQLTTHHTTLLPPTPHTTHRTPPRPTGLHTVSNPQSTPLTVFLAGLAAVRSGRALDGAKIRSGRNFQQSTAAFHTVNRGRWITRCIYNCM